MGVLVSKFRDKESHMWETIDYSDLSGTNRSLIFMNDRSDAFDFIIPGDSITKKTGGLEVIVKRKGVERKFQLDFGCPKKIN